MRVIAAAEPQPTEKGAAPGTEKGADEKKGAYRISSLSRSYG